MNIRSFSHILGKAGFLLLVLPFLCPNQARASSSNDILNVRDFGAFGDGASHPATSSDLKLRGLETLYSVGDEWDTIGIQETINFAKSGETVVLPAGSYFVFRSLKLGQSSLSFKSGLKLQGDKAILKARDTSGIALNTLVAKGKTLSDLTLNGISFENVSLRFMADDPFAIRNISLENCQFKNGGAWNSKESVYSYQLQLLNVEQFTVDGCSFVREMDFPGRSLGMNKTRYVRIINSTWSGFLKTAINLGGAEFVDGKFPDSGRNTAITIEHNQMTRAPGDYPEDHGIYAWGMKGMKILHNQISGWSLSPYGGSLKIRNGEDVEIRSNTLNGSGILLYTYAQWADLPPVPFYLRRVVVAQNRIDLTGSVADPGSINEENRPGISYWRNAQAAENAEADILIEFNQIISGNLVLYSPANGPSFKVIQNRASGFILYPTGVIQQNNQ